MKNKALVFAWLFPTLVIADERSRNFGFYQILFFVCIGVILACVVFIFWFRNQKEVYIATQNKTDHD